MTDFDIYDDINFPTEADQNGEEFGLYEELGNSSRERESEGSSREEDSRANIHGESRNDHNTEQAESSAIFIANLTWWTTDRDVEELVGSFGKTRNIKFVEDKINGKSKGCVIVEFYSPTVAHSARDGINKKIIHGKECMADFAPEQFLKQINNSRATGSVGAGKLKGSESGSVGDSKPPFFMGRGRGDRGRGGRGRGFGRGGGVPGIPYGGPSMVMPMHGVPSFPPRGGRGRGGYHGIPIPDPMMMGVPPQYPMGGPMYYPPEEEQGERDSSRDRRGRSRSRSRSRGRRDRSRERSRDREERRDREKERDRDRDRERDRDRDRDRERSREREERRKREREDRDRQSRDDRDERKRHKDKPSSFSSSSSSSRKD